MGNEHMCAVVGQPTYKPEGRTQASGVRVTILLPGAQYQHQGGPHAVKGRLSIAPGRGAFSYLAYPVGIAEPYLY
jgi:hypothetical protein